LLRLILLSILSVHFLFSQVLITEVMYDLVGSDSPNEFIELYNSSSTATVDLTSWTISDKNSTDDLIDTGDGLLLPPLGYALIFEGDYNFLTGIYSGIIPAGTIKIKVDDNSIGNSLSTSDSLYLRDGANNLIDKVGWTDIAADGYSIERVRLDLPNSASNWKSSKNLKGTPGQANSAAPLNIDGVLINNVSFDPFFAQPGESVVATVSVSNDGLQDISGSVNATFKGNTVGTINVPTLSSGQTTAVQITLSGFPSGRHTIIFTLSVASDQDLTNNTITKKLNVSYEIGAVKINEFHSNPGSNQIEFVELVSFNSIVMDGWSISDNSTTVRQLPIQYIEPGAYIVVAGDTSMKNITNPEAHYFVPYGGLPTLNNSGDAIYLRDNTNTVIDSLIYNSTWPLSSEISTEKLRPDFFSNDPANWKLSTDGIGMTPGYENSVYLTDNDGEIIAAELYHSPQFPNSNEIVELYLPVTNHGAEPISGIVRVNKANDLIGDANFSNLVRRDTVLLQISLPALESGIHPLEIIADIDGDTYLDNNSAADTVLVRYNFGDVLINEYLARPTSTQSEFVELFNNRNIDFTNWSISDKTNTMHYFTGDNVESAKFIVLSEDATYATLIPPEAILINVPNFPSLNNFGDAIFLRDFTGTVIDSLIYTSFWPSESGKSTEKIHPKFVSNDSTAWKVSADPTGRTPGRPNSVAANQIDGQIISEEIITTPQTPSSTDQISISIPISNIGLKSFSGDVLIEVNQQIIAESAFSTILPNDTAFVELTLQPLPSGIHDLTIYIDVPNDENIDNNSVVYPIRVSYDFGAVTLNEFLADPEAPLSEFVEIVAQETVNLDGWAISDNRKELEVVAGTTVNPGDFIVLSEDTSLANLIPPEAQFVEVAHFPSLNNSGDGIFIYDFTGKIIDSLHYNNSEWELESGKSTEKLHPDFNSTNATRWQLSKDTTNSTVGRVNSVVLQNVNGTIVSNGIVHYPEFPTPSESISITCPVVNTGLSNISGTVTVYNYGNELGGHSFTNLKSEDTTVVSFNIDPLPSGNNVFDIQLDVAGDMNSLDDNIEHHIYVSYPFGAVVLNEFLAAPDSSQAEFIEIVSFSNIDLTGWSISDNTLKKYFLDEIYIGKNQHALLSVDSAFISKLDQDVKFTKPKNGWPTLNNTADGIFLYDATGAIIDSLHYNEDWPIVTARSTEKFRPVFESNNPNRWGVAVNTSAMTPGLQNSLHFNEIVENGVIEFDANPFSPNGDGIDDELLIKYKLPFSQGIIKLQIYDMAGRNIATPYWNVFFPQEGLLKWDGRRKDGSDARIGIYIVKISAKDPTSSKIWEKVKTAVLAKQL